MLEEEGRWGAAGSTAEYLVDGGIGRIGGGGEPFWEYFSNDLLEIRGIGKLVAVVVSTPKAFCR